MLFKGNKYELVDVDFNKFRYRLFDGLTINDLIVRYPWILEAEISNAAIGLVDNELTWYSGVWECGRCTLVNKSTNRCTACGAGELWDAGDRLLLGAAQCWHARPVPRALPGRQLEGLVVVLANV